MPVWNPWHGCHKISPGCKHCYVFREDWARGVQTPTTEVRKTSAFNLPIRKDRQGNFKFPSGTEFALCFTSDFLIEEADEWRPQIWEMIRSRKDCTFYFFTKRIERLADALPDFWDEINDIVGIGCTVEAQKQADLRLPVFLDLPLRHRFIVVAPMIEQVELSQYLDTSLIESVSVGGESGKYARPLNFDWVINLREQCREKRMPFTFHQTGSFLLKDGKMYSIPRNHQHSQARKADLDLTF